jgi:hypothetical protein
MQLQRRKYCCSFNLSKILTIRISSQKLNFALHDELDRLEPDLFDMLATEGSHFMRNVRDKVSICFEIEHFMCQLIAFLSSMMVEAAPRPRITTK